MQYTWKINMQFTSIHVLEHAIAYVQTHLYVYVNEMRVIFDDEMY
jgi:hypothetical protein